MSSFRTRGDWSKRLASLRITGSHHVFARPGIAEQLNLQDRHGQAKPYQLRQLMTLVQRYDLRVEEGK